MSDDHETPMRCLACRGNFDLGGGRFCNDCDKGWMTPEQFGAFMAKRSGPRPAPLPPPTSTQRFDPHRVLSLDRMAKVWDGCPTRRFGELIVEAMHLQHMRPEQLATLPDDRLCEILEYFRMFGGG